MSDKALESLVSEWSLRELAERTGRSVGEVVEFAMSGRRSTSSPKATSVVEKKAKPAKKASAGGAVDTRTAVGRDAYRASVLGVLKDAGGFVGATDIRSKVGGTPGQARAALNRLIEDGAASFKGKRSATRYKAS